MLPVPSRGWAAPGAELQWTVIGAAPGAELQWTAYAAAPGAEPPRECGSWCGAPVT